MLASPSSGWLTVAGWQFLTASGGYLCGTLVQGLIALNNPEYNFQHWDLTFQGRHLGGCDREHDYIELAAEARMLDPDYSCPGLLCHSHTACVVRHRMAMPLRSFPMFLNEGGWQSRGLSFFICLQGILSFLIVQFAKPLLLTIETQDPTQLSTFTPPPSTLPPNSILKKPHQLSEYIANASTNVPRSILTSILLNGFLSFTILIAVPLLPRSKTAPPSSVTITISSCLLALINTGSAIASNNIISLTVNGLFSLLPVSPAPCCSTALFLRQKRTPHPKLALRDQIPIQSPSPGTQSPSQAPTIQ
ncbi:MAG: hypothetical protein Q9208_004356 [Pyrenodesmia sp. 3 TL-2023]